MDFTGATPVKLPGLVNGNIMALRLRPDEGNDNTHWAILGVESARIFNGDIYYFGNCLFFVIGDLTLVWKRLILPYENRLVTVAQLNAIPKPPYFTQLRLQPRPDGPTDALVTETAGLLITNVDWDPMNKFFISFKGDWCPLFRQPANVPPSPLSGGGFFNR